MRDKMTVQGGGLVRGRVNSPTPAYEDTPMLLRTLPRTRIVTLAVMPILLLGFAGIAWAQDFSAAPKKTLTEEEAVPGVVYIRYADTETRARAEAHSIPGTLELAKTVYGVTSVEPAFLMLDTYVSNNAVVPKSVEALRNVHLVRYSGPFDPLRVAQTLQRDPNIVFAEPKYIDQFVDDVQLPTVPNDPRFEGLEYMERMQMTDAWDVAKGEDSDVVVGIADGGTEWRHEDLEGNDWENPGEIPNNGVDDDDNGFIDDIRGWNFPDNSNDPTGLANLPIAAAHGTTVAGVAAALTNNELGSAGTSWNAKYMAINTSCEFFSAVCYGYEGILYAATNGATAVNVSWGGAPYSEANEMVIQAAWDMGTLVVAAAGNGGTNIDINPFYPASYDHVLAVGGTWDTSDRNFYNYGTSVGVFAAAVFVDGPTSNDGYRLAFGTSFSAPQVTGIAALVKTKFPDYGVGAIREQLRQTADNIDDVNSPFLAGLLGKGRVNAYRAVTETGFPGLRATAFNLIEEVDDDFLASGETIQVDVEITNYLSPASGLKIEISADEPFVSFESATADIGTLGMDESAVASFSFTLSDDTPYKSSFTLQLEAEADGYSEVLKSIPLDANGFQIATHNTGEIQFDITSEGNFGFLGFPFSEGNGWVIKDATDFPDQVIWEAGMVVGTGPNQVSDVVRSVFISTFSQDEDWVRKGGTSLKFNGSGQKAHQEGSVILDDKPAPNPTGIEILQESYSNQGENLDDHVLLDLTLKNTTSQTLSNVHVGLHFDLDVGLFLYDRAGYDPLRGLGYLQRGSAYTPLFAGIVPLNAWAPQHFTAVNMRGFHISETNDSFKWQTITGGINIPNPDLESDYAISHSFGPYTIAPGGTAKAAFAMVSGKSLIHLQNNVDAALYRWDTVHERAVRAQFIQTVSDGSAVDVYLYDQRAVNDAPPRLVTPYAPVPVISGLPFKVDIVAAGDADNSNPLHTEVLRVTWGDSYNYIVQGTADAVATTVVSKARKSSPAHNTATFYIAHGAPNLGELNVRLLSADDYSEVLDVLDVIDYGEATRYVQLIPDVYIVEFQNEGGYEVGVWRLDLNGQEGTASSLHLNGMGTSGRRPNLDLIHISPLGMVSLTPNITSSETAEALPEDFVLHGNYPNPFNPSTRIQFDLPSPARITVDIIDLLGRHVMTTQPEEFQGGTDRFITLDASSLASGTYIYRIRAEMAGQTAMQSGRMLLIK